VNGERLLTVSKSPNREVLQFSGISEIHFFLNPGSVRADRRYAEVERFVVHREDEDWHVNRKGLYTFDQLEAAGTFQGDVDDR
jgi:hypothetical protein